MSSKWKSRAEAGSSAGVAFVAWVAKTMGRRVVGVFLWPVVLYFMIVRGPERRASRAFLGRVLGRDAHLSEVFRHFHNFARVSTDRLFILTGRLEELNVVIHGRDLLQEVYDEGRGCIILSSHLGSFEATRAASFSRPDVRLHILLDRSQNPNFQRHIETFDKALAKRIIDASQPPTVLALRVADALKDGGWIGIPADRAKPGERTFSCRFLDADAPFPAGPFILSCAVGAPTVFATGLFLEGQYHLYFERLDQPESYNRKERKERAMKLTQAFADRLEVYARISPLSWFNFYPFWDVK